MFVVSPFFPPFFGLIRRKGERKRGREREKDCGKREESAKRTSKKKESERCAQQGGGTSVGTTRGRIIKRKCVPREREERKRVDKGSTRILRRTPSDTMERAARERKKAKMDHNSRNRRSIRRNERKGERKSHQGQDR